MSSSNISQIKNTSLNMLDGKCLNVLYSFNMDYPTRYNWLGLCICCFVLSPFIVVLNTMVLLTVYRKKELWTNTYFFLSGLALTDLFTGMVSLPVTGTVYFYVYDGWMTCSLYIAGFSLGYIIVGNSFASLCLLSTDRYFAVFHPYLYERKTHDKYLPWKITGVTWIIVTSLVFSSFFTARFIMYFVVVAMVMPLSIIWIFIVQAKIVKVVKRVSSDIENRNQPVTRMARREQRKYKRDRRVAYLAAVVVVTMVICYTPAMVVLFVVYLGLASEELFKERFVGYGWALTIANINSALNPLIFGIRMSEIKRGIKELIYMLFKQELSDTGEIHSSVSQSRFTIGQTNHRTIFSDLPPTTHTIS